MGQPTEDIPFPLTTIRLMRRGPIGWLVLNRPQRKNALDAAMWEAIPQAMETLRHIADVRVIILRGAGREAFCSGADIGQFSQLRQADSARAYEAMNLRALDAIKTAAVPTIAMIHGHCIGGGLALALACDIRLAADDARFALPPARIGLAYPLGGLADLLKAVSAAFAKEMIFTARALQAGEAARHGLVNAVHPAGELEKASLDLAARMAANAPLTIAHAKAAIDAIAAGCLDKERQRLTAMAAACEQSRDYAEGIAAFMEKRRPHFCGR